MQAQNRGTADVLLGEARVLWPESDYLRELSRRLAQHQRRTVTIEVLAAPGTLYAVDGAKYAGTGWVDEI